MTNRKMIAAEIEVRELRQQSSKPDDILDRLEEIAAQVELGYVCADTRSRLSLFPALTWSYLHAIKNQDVDAMKLSLTMGELLESHLLGLLGGEVDGLRAVCSIFSHVFFSHGLEKCPWLVPFLSWLREGCCMR